MHIHIYLNDDCTTEFTIENTVIAPPTIAQTDVKNLYIGVPCSLKYNVIGLKSNDTFTDGT